MIAATSEPPIPFLRSASQSSSDSQRTSVKRWFSPLIIGGHSSTIA